MLVVILFKAENEALRRRIAGQSSCCSLHDTALHASHQIDAAAKDAEQLLRYDAAKASPIVSA